MNLEMQLHYGMDGKFPIFQRYVDVDHLLCCKKGGYTFLRHDTMRDAFADLLKLFCRDVFTEPPLIKTAEELLAGTTDADGARLDVSARGIWNPFEKTLLDIRVTHPNAPSQKSKSLESIYNAHEKEKKQKYLDRVLQVEKASFIPVNKFK